MPEKTRKPTGPMGRTFNRILQVRENRSDTQDMAFNREQLKEFLDNGLQLRALASRARSTDRAGKKRPEPQARLQ